MDRPAGFITTVLFVCLLYSAFAFAQEGAPSSGDLVPAEEVAAELAIRDSVMTVHDAACKAETDSLRQTIETEQAKSANWEQSYNTVRQENTVCQQALRVTIDARTEKDSPAKTEAALMTGSSFLGGIALGMLLFWLIFD